MFNKLATKLAVFTAVALASASQVLAVATADPVITAAIDNHKATFDYGTPITITIIGIVLGIGLLKKMGRRAS